MWDKAESLLPIIQSISSPKAEPCRRWLAQAGKSGQRVVSKENSKSEDEGTKRRKIKSAEDIHEKAF